MQLSAYVIRHASPRVGIHFILFCQAYPIQDAVRTELSWTHYRRLIRIDNEQARLWYMQEAIEQNWSARGLDRQVAALYYERLLSSKDKPSVKQEGVLNTKGLSVPVRGYLREYLTQGYIIDQRRFDQNADNLSIDFHHAYELAG